MTDFCQVGLVGVGKVGEGIVKKILSRGHTTYVYDIDNARMKTCIAKGAIKSKSLEHLARQCDIVLLSLPSPQSVWDVVLGTEGLLEADCQGMLIVDLSTNAPHLVRDLGAHCDARGVGFLDAPLTGGMVAAEQGTFTVMIGGKQEDVVRAQPVLQLFSSRMVHVGPQGHGAATKLLHNMLGEIQVYAFAEAFCFAAKLGLNLNAVYDVLSHGMATSRILTELYARGALRRNFEPVATVDLAYKDQTLLLEMASSFSLQLTFSPIVYQHIKELQRRGLGNKDVTSAILLFEEAFDVVVNVTDEQLNQ